MRVVIGGCYDRAVNIASESLIIELSKPYGLQSFINFKTVSGKCIAKREYFTRSEAYSEFLRLGSRIADAEKAGETFVEL